MYVVLGSDTFSVGDLIPDIPEDHNALRECDIRFNQKQKNQYW